jgi:DNA-binding SARP family transcriptional activator/streptogramin lyase
LALLLLNANRTLAVEQLVYGLWGEDPPATAQKMLQIFISRLRRSLDDRTTAPKLVTQPAGYMIKVGEGELDLDRFNALVARAKALVTSEPGQAVEAFDQALALWRGKPLADLELEPFAQPVIARLEELHLAAVEARIEAGLAAGRHGELVGELRELVVQHPLREGLHAQLMLALYRAGRQVEALEVYTAARTKLGEELGLDPGPELQRLQLAILQQNDSLAIPARSTPVPQRPTMPPPVDMSTAQRRRSKVPRGRWRLLTAAALICVIAVAVSTRFVGPSVSTTANSLAAISADGHSILADVDVGSVPGPVAVSSGAVWVGNLADRTIVRIDLPALRPSKTFGLSDSPVSLAVGGSVVWIGNGFSGRLTRILIPYNQLSAPFFPGPAVSGLVAVAVTPSDLWVGLADNSLLRLDPTSLQQRASLTIPNHIRAIAVLDDAIWTIQFLDQVVNRVDTKSGALVVSTPLPGAPAAIAAGFGAVWVAASGGRLWKLDPRTGIVLGSIPLGGSATQIVLGAGSVWVADGPNGILERIDPTANELTATLNIGRPIGGLAASADRLWITID